MLTETAAAEDAGRIFPRLGPRLLVRARQGQHLRQALRLAARRTPLRLRSQVHLLAHRLQPEADRHAGGRRRGAASKSCPASSRLGARIPSAARGPARPGGVLHPARSHPGIRAKLVRLSDRRAPGAPIHAQSDVVEFLERNKIATRLLVRRQSRPPAGLLRTCATASSATLDNADFVMNQVFWIGVYPGITKGMVDYMLQILHQLYQ